MIFVNLYKTGNPGKVLPSQHSSGLAKKDRRRVWSFRLVRISSRIQQANEDTGGGGAPII